MTNIPLAPNPVQLTELAVQMVLEAMKQEGLDTKTHSLRIGVIGGGCSGLQYLLDFTDEPQEYDWVYHNNNIQVVVDQFSAMHLMGTIIDYVDGLSGSGFKFDNPTAIRKCGCGMSFS